ncbi:hypothetical protein KM043_008668 [Ampulex compressa]|nr:hypothetical protein KM043_008668 [Ampulex compressa]
MWPAAHGPRVLFHGDEVRSSEEVEREGGGWPRICPDPRGGAGRTATVVARRDDEDNMGIVTSTFTSIAIQIAWNCQRLLELRYGTLLNRCAANEEISKGPAAEIKSGAKKSLASDVPLTIINVENSSRHLENRTRRQRQLRTRRQSASFDSQVINTKNCPKAVLQTPRVVSSLSNSPQCRLPRYWDLTSSSGCSSDSGSDLDSDSGADFGTCQARGEKEAEEVEEAEEAEDAEARKIFAMSAAEETAFRLTVGRGHFSRSKKDKFLNHLRLEKRLNDMNKDFFDVGRIARYGNFKRSSSGDLRRIL